MHTLQRVCKVLWKFSTYKLSSAESVDHWFGVISQPSAFYSSNGMTQQWKRKSSLRRGRPKNNELDELTGCNSSPLVDIDIDSTEQSGTDLRQPNSAHYVAEQRNIADSSLYHSNAGTFSLRQNSSRKSIMSQLREAVASNELPDTEFPSDSIDVDQKSSVTSFNNKKKRDQTQHAYRPDIDPSGTSIVLFPGEGSQFVGMGAQLIDYPNVAEMYKLASRILSFDLLEMCLHGPADVLNKTIHSQPAVLVTSLAAVEKLKYENPKAIENCVSTSGYNIGEYSALVFAGAMSFEDAVRLVKVRSSSMQSASHLISGGMLKVHFGASGKIKFACHAAKLYCRQELGMDDAVCEITSYLHPGCKILSGNRQGLEFIEKNRNEFGINCAQHLPFSGAFHCRLMHSGIAAMSRTLSSIQFNDPIVPVHSNVTGLRYRSAKSIGKLLTEQIWRPVRWEQTMHVLYGRPVGSAFPWTYEVGPGKQLGEILQLINAKAFEQYSHVEV